MKRLEALIKFGKKKFIAGLGIGLLVIILMANLSALIDRVAHPEIPYFDHEHLIVGGLTAIVTALMLTLLMIYVTNLQMKDYEIRKLNEELEQKVEERTRQLIDTQKELLRSEKLAMLGLIAGNMGNELRNPLGVMNNAVFFLENILPDADVAVREYLEIIRSEIDSSQRIISDLLDFCQDKPCQANMISVQELIPECLKGCALPEIIRLSADLPESLPPVKADPLQMEQVLQNLITNAVQAMPNGGALRIAARRVLSSEFGVLSSNLKTEILDPETGVPLSSGLQFLGSNSELKTQNLELDFIEISVADTGTGIAPENMAKLFQPLFTTKSRGIGLGLAISRKLVEANGGTIEVESRLGYGATFTVTLPVGGG